MSIIIGMGYKKRNGKDYVSNVIKEEFGSMYNIRLYSFAKSLKEEINHDLIIYGSGRWNRLFEYYKEFEDLPINIKIEANPDMSDLLCPYGKQRQLLQWWGIRRRSQDSCYWIKKVAEELKIENPTIGIVTDVRFPNEFWWIKSFGRDGITVKVERLGFVNENEHISEIALDSYEFDYTLSVENNNLHQLKQDALELFSLIQQRYYMPPEMLNWNLERQ